MFLDAIETAAHNVYSFLIHAVADARQRLLEDKAVAIAYLAKERRKIIETFARDEAALVEEYHELEAKVAKAEEARARISDFLSRL